MSKEIMPGDTVTLDKKYANKCTVEVVWVGKYFATVKSENQEWDVMKNRLTKKETQSNDL